MRDGAADYGMGCALQDAPRIPPLLLHSCTDECVPRQPTRGWHPCRSTGQCNHIIAATATTPASHTHRTCCRRGSCAAAAACSRSRRCCISRLQQSMGEHQPRVGLGHHKEGNGFPCGAVGSCVSRQRGRRALHACVAAQLPCQLPGSGRHQGPSWGTWQPLNSTTRQASGQRVSAQIDQAPHRYTRKLQMQMAISATVPPKPIAT